MADPASGPPRRRASLPLAALLWILGAAAAAAQATWGPPGWSPGGVAAGAAEPAVVATRPIPSRTVLTESDVALRPSPFGAGLTDPAEAVGMETRVALYAGRPIRAEDLGPPALVERNALVLLRYQRGALFIAAEGRALDRGAVGDRIRVTNLSSRQTVFGRVAADGAVEVRP
ncbi:flagellar basal body P-ring formation chaperone FlgA [Albimonas pacifica]|uniref:Flagella basal body P-ring formation protein FlgA n=1 Tax=Albimonas pacifica TaxID=1114924 RepID=A0A1I3FRC9_9RHOB|nr:flagellar basal body P-ring formation chaperone FlgA [Albimonas pacifica]SFI13642.1 flagella basal body P-ring formation protein FlgA [Albimonas pacifica]